MSDIFVNNNTRVIVDIASTYPVLLTHSSLRGTCKSIWSIWIDSNIGKYKHYEYIAANTRVPAGSLRSSSQRYSLAIPSTFVWGRITLPRVDTEHNTKYKYVMNVRSGDHSSPRDIGTPLFSYTVSIMMRYHFEDVTYRYYTYTFTKTDNINGIVMRRSSSIGYLYFNTTDVCRLDNAYTLFITTPHDQCRYRIDDHVNLCIHDNKAYPITLAEMRRMTEFMQSSSLDFLAGLPPAIVKKREDRDGPKD